MLITRSVGKILRGKSTPLQLFLACILGGVLGFVPGFRQAPGLMVLLFVLFAILHANLIVAAIVAATGQFVSLVMTPITFAVGQALLDGPMQPFFKILINAPGTALLGLEYYVTTGGIAVGLIYGFFWAIFVIAVVQGFRRRMAARAGKEGGTMRKLARSPVGRLVIWVIFGPKARKSYEEIARRRFGLPFRPLGVLFVAGVALVVYLGRGFITEDILTPVLTRQAQVQLERVNGATVDIESVRLDLENGSIVVRGLAIADRKRLDRDVFRASRLEGAISGVDLLRKRLTIDEVIVSEAYSGSRRSTPGRIVGKRPAPKPEGEGKTLEDYLEQYEEWKERLEQIESWIDKIARRDPTRKDKPEGEESYRQRIEREVALLGYRRVVAAHLIDKSPTLLVRRIQIDAMKVDALPDDPVDVVVLSISTQPWLVDTPPDVSMQSRSGAFGFSIGLGSIARTDPSTGTRRQDMVHFHQRAIPGAWVEKQLKIKADRLPVRAQTFDLVLDGPIRLADGVRLGLNLDVLMHQALVNVPGVGQTTVDRLTLPIALSGRLSAPRIGITADALVDALRDVGRAALADQLRKALGIDSGKGILGDEGSRILDGVGGDLLNRGIDGLLGGGRDRRKEDPKDPPDDPR
ncbi:MAG: hypothetical protein KIT24_11190 [Phycisphaeraceae bacterium]|nr:hypothetical protein [Phycisphaeraceae bacterium]